ncbi:MAG TPA: hypothetical protein VMT00_02240, partial [Thermoanaerobaculia bacterium]|nr:hypothetical protein [Thermoanaerobaculia bacterium]
RRRDDDDEPIAERPLNDAIDHLKAESRRQKAEVPFAKRLLLPPFLDGGYDNCDELRCFVSE